MKNVDPTAAIRLRLALYILIAAFGCVLVNVGLLVHAHGRPEPSAFELRARDHCLGVAWRLRDARKHDDANALRSVADTDDPYTCAGRALTPTRDDALRMEREIRDAVGAP